MPPLIKIKSHTLKMMQPIFAPGEQIQVAIPCGRMHFDPGTVIRAKDRDYLIITNKRLVSIRGAWFQSQQGLQSWTRNMILGVDVDEYLLGSTVRIHVQPHKAGDPSTVEFPNCSKPEAETIQKMFSEQALGRRCPGCGRPLSEEFTFCPFCKTSLKRLCRNCGKPQQDGWVNCPYCGM